MNTDLCETRSRNCREGFGETERRYLFLCLRFGSRKFSKPHIVIRVAFRWKLLESQMEQQGLSTKEVISDQTCICIEHNVQIQKLHPTREYTIQQLALFRTFHHGYNNYAKKTVHA